MKKLYGKRKIHPSHHHHQPSVISDQYLSFLPATILTLTVALSVEDREVLAYLISCNSTISSSSSSSVVKLYSNRSNNNKNNNSSTATSTSYNKKSSSSRSKDDHHHHHHHPVLFNCNCFTCYMSYWVRWDSSSNRQLIHEIIDAYEDDELTMKKVIMTSRRKDTRRNKKAGFHGGNYLKNSDEEEMRRNMMGGGAATTTGGELKSVEERIAEISEEETGEEDEADESGTSSIRKCMDFLVSKIFDIWNPK